MRILIAVKTCAKPEYVAKAESQFKTWAKPGVYNGKQVDIIWIVGGAKERGAKPIDGRWVVETTEPDGYNDLWRKTQFACQLATNSPIEEERYDFVVLVDDDTYLQIERLVENLPIGHDYAGRLRGASGVLPAMYCSGFAYILSQKAAALVAKWAFPDDAEDRMVGNLLSQNGIHGHNMEVLDGGRPEDQFVIVTSNKSATSGGEGPRKGNHVIASGEYGPEMMLQAHEEWQHVMSGVDGRVEPSGTPFDSICVLVKTFLRDGLLKKCIASIEQHMPGARIIVVDDGRASSYKITDYARLRRAGHTAVWMDFDSGFGAKNNYAIKYMDRPYTLIYSDDFIADEKSAAGVLDMYRVLEHDRHIGVASGRVDDIPYEGFLKYVPINDKSKWVDVYAERLNPKTSIPMVTAGEVRVPYHFVDMTVNYNLVRREVFDHVKWDEQFKIGGDHVWFYEQVKQRGYLIAWVPGVSVHQQVPKDGDVHEDYGWARSRARLALPELYRRCRWKSFLDFAGTKTTLEDVDAWVVEYNKKPAPVVLAPPKIYDRGKERREREAAAAKSKER